MMRRNTIETMLGTDAEYVMVTAENKLVPAYKYVEVNSKFGRDANQNIFEIKSDPDSCPIKVTNSIKRIMQEAVDNDPCFCDFTWLSGTYVKNLPLGGHIHCSLRKGVINPNDLAQYFLDHYIGAISLLLESKKEGIKRRSFDTSPSGNPVSYGKAGDVRVKKAEAGRVHFEYRTCSSFLSSPHATNAMLALSKVVLFEAINNKSFEPRVYISPEDFVTMNVEKVRKLFPQIWSDICSMALYPAYRSYLDIIPRYVHNGWTWNYEQKDMKKTWGIITNNSYFDKAEWKPAKAPAVKTKKIGGVNYWENLLAKIKEEEKKKKKAKLYLDEELDLNEDKDEDTGNIYWDNQKQDIVQKPKKIIKPKKKKIVASPDYFMGELPWADNKFFND